MNDPNGLANMASVALARLIGSRLGFDVDDHGHAIDPQQTIEQQQPDIAADPSQGSTNREDHGRRQLGGDVVSMLSDLLGGRW